MPGELRQILDQNKQMKVLVIGDLILDEYLWGTVSRISPEAPVPILGFTSENKVLGGAGNVANNLKALGCEVHLCGVVGNDEKGRQVLDLLRQKGIHGEGVLIDSSRPTIHKLRVIAHSQQMLRIDRELKSPIQSGVLQKAIQYLMEVIPQVDGIICSDYQKGFLTKELLGIIVQHAGKRKIRVALDPKGSDYSRYRGVDVITPNLQEVKTATRLEVTDEKELDQAVEEVFAITQSRLILVTQGAEGMTLYENGRRKTRIPAEAREVYDVTGAGDTVIAVFSLGLFGGVDIIDAAKLANKAAGIVVGKVGTATVSCEELSHYLEDGPSLHGRKIVTIDECRQILSQSRNNGRKIIFTNGCFDLLHIGHIKYLQEAKKYGDLLVIGLNDDQSVRQIKGPERPIVGEAERARILAALDCVDYVVLFSESTPERLLVDLRPDVLVKGTDYTLDQVVGRDIVEGYGGRVELIPLVPGRSTSKLVRSIIEKYGQNR